MPTPTATPRSPGRSSSDKRFREAILHVALRCDTDPTFGATKLNKILHRADFNSYGARGKAITGQDYVRRQYGPVPKALVPVRNRMIADKVLIVVPREYQGQPQQRPVALRAPDLSVFEPEEVALLDGIIQELWGLTATEVSRRTHDAVWEAFADGETIPFRTVFFSNRPLSKRERAHAASL